MTQLIGIGQWVVAGVLQCFQAHSRNTRCCGSISSASRGVTLEERCVKERGIIYGGARADIAGVLKKMFLDPFGAQFLVAEKGYD